MTTQTAPLTEQVQGSPVALTETEAAELEGLVDINDEQLKKAKRYRQLADRKAAIEAEMDEIKKDLKSELSGDGIVGLIHRGRVLVRRKVVVKPFLDAKRLKAEKPEIAAEYAGLRTEVHLVVG